MSSYNYSQSQMLGLGVAFTILPAAFVGARLFARRIQGAKLGTDDYLIIVACAFSISCCVVQLIAAIDGQLGQHQTDAPNGMPILNDPRFLKYERCKFALQMLSVIGLGLTKSSILFFYMRIFATSSFRLAGRILVAIVTAWTIAFFFTNLFTCIPVTALVEQFYGNKCINTIPMWYTESATDIALDLTILSMPIQPVMNLHLPTNQKIAVMGIFLLGATVCAASVTRVVVFVQIGSVLQIHYNDETYYTSPVFFWTVIELALGVIAACLPTLRPLFTQTRSRPWTKMSSYWSSLSSQGTLKNQSKSSSTTQMSRSKAFDSRSDTADSMGTPFVQTHIEGIELDESKLPRAGVIRVQNDISTSNRSFN